MSKIQMKRVSDNEFNSDSGLILKREYGKTPNGNNVGGRWVLRSSDGNWIDMDMYSNDLADRNNLDLYTSNRKEEKQNVLEEITNEYGFPQYVDDEGNPTCPSCRCLVMKNRGAGCICDTCAHEAHMEMSADYDEGNLAIAISTTECSTCGSTSHGNGFCSGSETDYQSETFSQMEEEEKLLDKEAEKEAMRRYFAGEDPGWTTGVCEFLQAGYGKLSDLGYWEFTLPAPAEQWQKKKDFQLKVKLNGMKYKARIIPFDSNEIIKRNFVHWCYDYHFWSDKHSEESMKTSYDFYVNRLRETRDASGFLLTASVGESVQEHKGRIYLEIVDPTYPAAGRTPEEHMGS